MRQDILSIDAGSQTWRVVKDWAEAEILRAHVTLESPSLTEANTNVQRGRIAALRELLAMTDPVPVIPSVNTPYTG